MCWRTETMAEKVKGNFDLVLGLLLLVGMTVALYMTFLVTPRESTMGDVQRIFYFHVPAGITALTAFALNFVACLMYLIRRNRWWDHLALTAAEVGVMFLSMLLITGPDRKSTRLNSSHGYISYAVFCLKKKKTISA